MKKAWYRFQLRLFGKPPRRGDEYMALALQWFIVGMFFSLMLVAVLAGGGVGEVSALAVVLFLLLASTVLWSRRQRHSDALHRSSLELWKERKDELERKLME